MQDLIYCKCGCGRKDSYLTKMGTIRKYIFGHQDIGKVRSEKIKEKLRTAWVLKYPININYFKNLNSRNAYVLGYLFADGHLRKRKYKNQTSLSFSSVDEELIDKIKLEFGIEKRKTRMKRHNNNWKDRYCLSITNYHFIKYLEKQSMIHGKKCDRISIPKTITQNKTLFIAFFRGFFDGDGSINSIKNSSTPRIAITTASYKFLIQLKNIIFKFGINSKSIKKAKTNRVFRLRFSGKQNVYNLYKLIYQNSNNLYLSRKKKRFEEYFKTYNWRLI